MAIITVIAPNKYGCKLNLDDVEIGDILAPNFRPHVKLKRFANQCDMAISYPTSSNLVTLDSQNNKLIFTEDTNTSIEIYPKDPDDLNPEGSIEIDLVLKKKPTGNKNTFTFKVESSTIDFHKIVGLDKEYDQARCLEDFPKHTPPFVITPTSITDSTGEVMESRPEYLVNSYEGRAKQNKKDTSILGKNKNNGQDITYTRLSRTHAHLRRGKMKDALGAEAWVEDMNLDVNGNLIFTLPLDFLKNATYPIKQAVGLDPAYTQDWDSWQSNGYGGSDGVWGDYDLFTNKGVPKGAVAEIILSNSTTGTENSIGVRTDGSSWPTRYANLHEAEGDGQTHCRMFVVCHATTGLIECYHSDVSDADYFYLVGYWENVSFTETFRGFGSIGTGPAWITKTLDPGAANKIAHIYVYESTEIAETVGVRAIGSSLDRKLLIHEEEAGGSSYLDFLVKADANYQIEVYTSSAIGYANWGSNGYFGSEMDFVEKWEQLNPTNGVWSTLDLTAYLDQDGRMCDFLLTHSNGGAEYYLGVRDGNDTTTERKLLEHEAESAGAGGEYAGFGMSARSNSSGIVSFYTGVPAEDNIFLTGYFNITVIGAPTSLASPSQTSTTIDLTWTKGINADKTLIRFKEGEYPTSKTDGYEAYFDTGESVTVQGKGYIIQALHNAAAQGYLYTGSRVRCGERVNNFPATNISRVSFCLLKFGTPIGTAYVRIRKVSDDSILATIAEINVEDLTASSTWYNFDCNVNNPTPQDLRFLVEYDGGNAANAPIVRLQNTDVLADAVYSSYIDSWTDNDSLDFAIKIYLPLQPATTYYFRAWGYNSTYGDYSVGTADLTQATSGGAQWKKLAFASEPPTANAWNQLKLEAGTGWKKLLLEGE